MYATMSRASEFGSGKKCFKALRTKRKKRKIDRAGRAHYDRNYQYLSKNYEFRKTCKGGLESLRGLSGLGGLEGPEGPVGPGGPGGSGGPGGLRSLGGTGGPRGLEGPEGPRGLRSPRGPGGAGGQGGTGSHECWAGQHSCLNQPNHLIDIINNISVNVSKMLFLILQSKLYTPSTLNIVLILWHTHLNVCAVK